MAHPGDFLALHAYRRDIPDAY